MNVAPELEALLRACFAEPSANLPRLVLADYLEERGHTDRATVLRLQCELPPPEAGQKAKVKRGAGKDLKAAIARLDKMFAPLRRFKVPFEFVRGFLTVRINLTDLRRLITLRKCVAALCRAGWVETLHLRTLYRFTELRELLAYCRDVGVLDCSTERISADTLLTVATELQPGSSNSRLRTLAVHPDNQVALAKLLKQPISGPTEPVDRNLYFPDLTPEAATQLAQSGILDGVDNVTLVGNPGEVGIQALADSPAVGQLRHLTLGRELLTAAVLRPLWAVTSDRLESLALASCHLGDDGVREFCGGRFFPSRRLDMSRVGLTPDGVQALTECRQLARLTRLTLNGNSISEEGVRAILRSPTFARLSQLGVEECGVSIEEAIAAVFAAPARPELTVYLGLGAVALNRPAAGTANFSLSGAGSSPRAVRVLLPDTCPESLSEVQLVRSTERQIPLADLGRWLTGQTIPSLRLLHCGLRNGDVPNLIALMERLRPSTLDLSGNEIGMRGIQALADSPALQTVQHLNLSGNAVNLKGLLALAASPHRGALTNLVLQYCRLSDAVKSALTSAFNGVKVQL